MPFDRFDACFLKVTPRKHGTFSHGSRPCRYEPPIEGRTFRDRLRCPFKANGYCDDVMASHLPGVLKSAYSEAIKNTLAEASTSIVVRSEQQFHGLDRHRLAQRRHLYEVVKNGTAPDESRFGVQCSELVEDDRLGEYLGFVDLREYFDKSPLALGLLVEPGAIREDRNAFVIQGDYGPLFGSHSFRSTVYSMQDPGTIGAKCAQMCAIMALGMLGDRKARIRGSFSLTFLAWLVRWARSQHLTPEQALKLIDTTASGQPLDSFSVGGIKAHELPEVLRLCDRPIRAEKWRCR